MHSNGPVFPIDDAGGSSHWPVLVMIVGAVLSYYGLIYEVGGLWLQRSFLQEGKRALLLQRTYIFLRRLRLVAPIVVPSLRVARLAAKPLPTGLTIRPWAESDRAACTELYQLNAPGRFPAGVDKDFENTMSRETASLLVIEKEGRVIACGGVDRGEVTATLSFGLIHPEFHGQGIGRLLLIARLCRLEMTQPLTVQICAVADSVGYYEAFGFERYALWYAQDGSAHPQAAASYYPFQQEPVMACLQKAGYPVLPPVTASPLVPASDQR